MSPEGPGPYLFLYSNFVFGRNSQKEKNWTSVKISVWISVISKLHISFILHLPNISQESLESLKKYPVLLNLYQNVTLKRC